MRRLLFADLRVELLWSKLLHNQNIEQYQLWILKYLYQTLVDWIRFVADHEYYKYRKATRNSEQCRSEKNIEDQSCKGCSCSFNEPG